MNGTVDDYGRALVAIRVRNPEKGIDLVLDAWIDTGFTSYLLLSPEQFTTLELIHSGDINAVVSDGSEVEFPLCDCEVEWFGTWRRLKALVGPGRFALVGVHLLEDLVLSIDYPARTVVLEPSPSAHLPGPGS